ncbi:MAG: hypothetical protein R6U84_10070 [Candidatus Cloacimonadales bacterium]
MSIENELKFLENLKFNLGAFLLTPIWCFVHGKLLSTISLIIIWAAPLLFELTKPFSLIFSVTYFALALYYGIKGNEIAMESGKYRNEAELEFANKKWFSAGIIFIITYFVVSSIWHSVESGANILQIGLDAIL